MKKMRAKITPEHIVWSEIFDYKDGNLYWKPMVGSSRTTKSRNSRFSGKIAGSCDNKITVEGEKYYTYRIIWEMHFGKITDDSLQIDHIDGDRKNNRIENLRLVSQSENLRNLKTVKGYYFNKSAKKWAAEIRFNNSKKFIGYFDTEQEARFAYLSEKIKLHGKDLTPSEMLIEYENLLN